MDSEAIPIEAPFAASFPLPFRVLVLAGTGILCWATNLHGLHLLGVDAAAALEFRSHDAYGYGYRDGHGYGRPSHPSLRLGHSLTNPSPPDSLALARAVYRLCVSYAFVVFTGWAVFRFATLGELALVDVYKWIPAVTMLVVIMLAISPFNVFEKRIRDMFLLAVRRCLFSSMNAPVYFCDVVLADIFTSFAKVIGDVWLSFSMITPGGSLLVFPQQYGWTRLMVPCLLSIPYGVRFRQCIIDYMQSSTTNKKQLYNALKYATSFPVIFLSAAQREIVSEAGAAGVEVEEHPLFRLWLLSVAVNSLYSFWWDVTNDWGLEIFLPKYESHRQSLKPLVLPALQAHRSSLDSSTSLHARRPSLSNGGSPDPRPSPLPPFTSSMPPPSYSQRPYPWGLRPILLFPLPFYPMAIFTNLVLRLTWSLKLSAHLHAQVSGALLFFWLELAELLRRWVWVFFRVEWEFVKREKEMEKERESVPMQMQMRMRGDVEGNEENGYEDGVGIGVGIGIGIGIGAETSGAERSIYDDSRGKVIFDDGLP